MEESYNEYQTTSGNLSMSSATYARSRKGIEGLKSNVQSDLDKAEKAVLGDDYNKFLKTLNNNWSGPDADEFIAKFEMSANSIGQNINELKRKFAKALDDDKRGFDDMQRRNANNISGNGGNQ